MKTVFDAVVSFDLPWSARKVKTAAAVAFPDGSLSFTLPGEEVEIVNFLENLGAKRALVLLDIPVYGVDKLSALRPFRAVDMCLMRSGIPLLPSHRAGLKGLKTAREIKERFDRYAVVETYPYAILKFIWYFRCEPSILESRLEDRLDINRWASCLPPRYKRSPLKEARASGLREVVDAVGTFLPGLDREYIKAFLNSGMVGLKRISDCVDSIMSLIAGISFAKGSPYSILAWRDGEEGALLLLADGVLRKKLGENSATVKDLNDLGVSLRSE